MLISHYVHSSKDLHVVDIQNPTNPRTIEVKKLMSDSLKIDQRTSVVQHADGCVYFSGGHDSETRQPHFYVGEAKTDVPVQPALEEGRADGRHEQGETVAQRLSARIVRVRLFGQAGKRLVH